MEELIRKIKETINKTNNLPPSFFVGEMGVCFSLYLINKIKCDDEIEQMADNLLDKVVNSIITMKDTSFVNGLAGIGWAINYLHMKNCLGGDADEILYNIDATIYKKVHNHQDRVNIDFEHGFIGYLAYVVFRLMNEKHKDNNLQKQLNEATLRAIIDKLEMMIPYRIPIMSKDLYSTLTWEFPILFYCLGKALKLGIYKEKICSMYGNWSYLFTCILPYLNINRLAIANSLAYSNSVIKNQSIGSYIDTLFYSVNFNSYIHEIGKESVQLCGDWFYAMLNSYMARILMNKKHIRYPELEDVNKKIQYLYNTDATETLYNMGDAQPNITLINGCSGALLVYYLFHNDLKNENTSIII